MIATAAFARRHYYCPVCCSGPQKVCRDQNGVQTSTHPERIDAAVKDGHTRLATTKPLCFTPRKSQ